MVKIFFAACIGCLAVSASSIQLYAAPTDSVGVIIKNGDRFIRHQVVPKENIYSVSRKYHVPVTKITQANPGLKTLIVGQEIYIPVVAGKQPAKQSWPKVKTADKPKNASVKPTGPALFDGQGNRVHKVDTKQTLYAIARMYGVSTSDIKTWNNLPDDNVHDNQTLIVKLNNLPQKPAVATTISPVNPVKPESTAIAAAPAVVSRPDIIHSPSSGDRHNDTTETVPAPRVTFSRITESGLAELIGAGVPGNKYLALHKTVPIGSFVTVRNLMNNQTVSVRVIGKLPDIGSNEKVVVKISKRAFQRLGAIDNRFMVEVQYEVADKILSSNQ